MTDPAPFVLPSRYVLDLRSLGIDANRDAAASVERLRDEVVLRQSPNVHRYELLARQQHVALLAATVASALEEAETGPTNPPLRVAEGVVRAYKATHYTERGGDLTDRALASAAERVLDSVRAVQAEDEETARYEAEQDERIAEYERRHEL